MPDSAGPVAPFAWAGFHTFVPRAFRPYQIDGDGLGGFFVLGDDERARFELRWAVARKGADADGENLCTYRLRRTLGRKAAAEMLSRLVKLDMPGWAPLFHLKDAATRSERYLGFNTRTGRVIDAVYFLGDTVEDRIIKECSIPFLCDVPIDQLQPWSFFDMKFMTPPGFRYLDATLNVGDMKVALGEAVDVWKGAWLSVRQLYPADLALSRMSEDAWMDMVIEEERKYYRPKLKRTGKRRLLYPRVMTTRGPALAADATLVWRLRPFFRRIPRRRRTWLIHDTQVNRIVILNVAAPEARLDPLLGQLVEHLHHVQSPPLVQPSAVDEP